MGRLQTLKPQIGTLGARLGQAGANWREGKTTNERGYTYKWQKARARFLVDHPLCTVCEAEGRVAAATVVDHHIPHRGDQTLFWDESNWRPMCKSHHDAKTQKEGKDVT